MVDIILFSKHIATNILVMASKRLLELLDRSMRWEVV